MDAAQKQIADFSGKSMPQILLNRAARLICFRISIAFSKPDTGFEYTVRSGCQTKLSYISRGWLSGADDSLSQQGFVDINCTGGSRNLNGRNNNVDAVRCIT